MVLVALVMVTHRFAHWDLKDPDVTLRLFTFVGACAVLDSRLASQPVLVQGLGVVALVSCLALIVLSARNMSACTWSGLRDRAHGAWELASVGTSGLAIVAAKLARYTSEHLVAGGGRAGLVGGAVHLRRDDLADPVAQHRAATGP